MKSLNCDFFPMATTVPWVKDRHSCMASIAVTQCFYSSSEGSASSPALATWLHRWNKTRECCSSGPVQMTVCVLLFRHPRFLLCEATFELHTAKWPCSRLNVSGNLTWPSPTSPHCRLSARPKSLLEFRKVKTKACFWYLLGYIVILS